MQVKTSVRYQLTPGRTASWVDPEDIGLSEISQREKDKYCMVPLKCGV